MKFNDSGCGCGTLGTAVTPYASGPRFKYDHQKFLLTVNCIELMKIKKKASSRPFKKRICYSLLIIFSNQEIKNVNFHFYFVNITSYETIRRSQILELHLNFFLNFTLSTSHPFLPIDLSFNLFVQVCICISIYFLHMCPSYFLLPTSIHPLVFQSKTFFLFPMQLLAP